MAFNDCVGHVRPHYKEQSVNLDVVNNSALSLKNYEDGKTWLSKE